MAFTIFSILLFVFINWAWKLSIFKNWLVLIPNIAGVWIGTIKYQQKKPLNDILQISKRIIMIINQSLLELSIIVKTKEMESLSFIGGFDINKEQGRKRICYSYTSKARILERENNPIHDGTALLNIEGDPPVRLYGEYWTSRRTIGIMRLKKKK